MSLYSEIELHELQLLELEMLKEVKLICEKLSLRYYLIGGTLLGAIRHKGFIPWDDDIDIAMPRIDYEIFIVKAKEYLSAKFFLQTNATDPEYPQNFCKIRNSKTTFIEKGFKNCRINHGIFLDIFPLDWYPEGGLQQCLFKVKNRFLSTAIYMEVFKERPKGIKEKLLFFFARRLPLKKAVEKRDKLFKSVKESKRLVNHCGAWGEKEIFLPKWFEEEIEVEFEGLTVKAPKDYHLLLTQMYGDYMQLPSPEKRVAHHDTEIFDLKKSYKEYME